MFLFIQKPKVLFFSLVDGRFFPVKHLGSKNIHPIVACLTHCCVNGVYVERCWPKLVHLGKNFETFNILKSSCGHVELQFDNTAEILLPKGREFFTSLPKLFRKSFSKNVLPRIFPPDT